MSETHILHQEAGVAEASSVTEPLVFPANARLVGAVLRIQNVNDCTAGGWSELLICTGTSGFVLNAGPYIPPTYAGGIVDRVIAMHLAHYQEDYHAWFNLFSFKVPTFQRLTLCLKSGLGCGSAYGFCDVYYEV